jgi:predicted nucleic acid-binding Zn ribbon protein
MPQDPYRELRGYTAAKTAEPQHVGKAISELIALKGLARVHGTEQLQQAWRTVAGEEIGRKSRVIELTRGVLHVGVGSSALFNELAGFHKQTLLETLQQQFAHLKIREIKFRLKTDPKSPQ